MENYPVKISKAYLNTLPLGKYQGDIHIITNRKEELNAIEALKKEELLGFDTETRPSFTKGIRYPTTLVQLAGESAVYLFRLNHIGFNHGLQQILSNPNITKVGVAVRDDIKDLRRISRFHPSKFEDLNTIAQNLQIENLGLRNLAAIFLGLRISKTAQVSPWHQTPLKRNQIFYAATDAWACREIYLELKNGNLID